jgi:hypothetical protein
LEEKYWHNLGRERYVREKKETVPMNAHVDSMIESRLLSKVIQFADG